MKSSEIPIITRIIKPCHNIIFFPAACLANQIVGFEFDFADGLSCRVGELGFIFPFGLFSVVRFSAVKT